MYCDSSNISAMHLVVFWRTNRICWPLEANQSNKNGAWLTAERAVLTEAQQILQSRHLVPKHVWASRKRHFPWGAVLVDMRVDILFLSFMTLLWECFLWIMQNYIFKRRCTETVRKQIMLWNKIQRNINICAIHKGILPHRIDQWFRLNRRWRPFKTKVKRERFSSSSCSVRP